MDFLFLLLVFLIPITLYCLILGGINRRPYPLMASGFWDTVGLLFASSGFFLVVLPGLLQTMYVRSFREPSLEGPASTDPAALFREWWWIWLLYYLVLLIGGITLIWFRLPTTIVYNVYPEDFEKAFGRVLDKLGLVSRREGKRIVLVRTVEGEEAGLFMADSPAPGLPAAPAPAEDLSQCAGVLIVHSFPALCNITMHWERQAPVLRQEMEKELVQALNETHTLENSAGGWLLVVGGALSSLIFLIVLVMVLLTLFRRH